MTAPLSGPQFPPEAVSGMFGGPRRTIRPRGAYTFAGTGDPLLGYNGYGMFWQQYPSVIGGQQIGPGPATETGAPVGTPDVTADQLKVGGGPLMAEVPEYGGTAGTLGVF